MLFSCSLYFTLYVVFVVPMTTCGPCSIAIYGEYYFYVVDIVGRGKNSQVLNIHYSSKLLIALTYLYICCETKLHLVNVAVWQHSHVSGKRHLNTWLPVGNKAALRVKYQLLPMGNTAR